MHEKILVTDAYVGHTGREEKIGHAGQYLIEVDDKVGTAALYLVGYETHALPVFGKHTHVVCQTVCYARTPVVGLGQEIRTKECLYLRPYATLEKIGQ